MKQGIAHGLLRLVEFARKEPVLKALGELEDNQYLRAEALQKLQQTKLQSLLRSALAASPFWRATSARPKSAEVSLKELPLLDKAQLRENYAHLISCDARRPLDLCKTSGSTGAPLKFYRDRVVFAYTLAALYRGHRWYGLDVGAKEAMLWGIPSDPLARTKMHLRDLVLNRFREREYDLSPKVLQQFYDDCRRRKPAYLFGYTSMVYEFALFIKERGLDGRALRFAAAICTAESIPDYQRAAIEQHLGCPVVSEYGSAETGIISYQCPKGSHHVSDDTVLIELLDNDGQPVPDGEIGRVVATVLHSHSAPIIRYALGDLAVRKPGLCECGISLSMLERIVGRTSGVIVTPSGRCFHSIALYYILKDFAGKYGNVRQFKTIQTHPDHLEFHLVLDGEDNPESEAYLMRLVKKKFGDEMRVTFIKTDQIPRNASGKLSDFESRVNAMPTMLESFRAHSDVA